MQPDSKRGRLISQIDKPRHASKIRPPNKKPTSDNLLGGSTENISMTHKKDVPQNRLGKSHANPKTVVNVDDEDENEDYTMTPAK